MIRSAARTLLALALAAAGLTLTIGPALAAAPPSVSLTCPAQVPATVSPRCSVTVSKSGGVATGVVDFDQLSSGAGQPDDGQCTLSAGACSASLSLDLGFAPDLPLSVTVRASYLGSAGSSATSTVTVRETTTTTTVGCDQATPSSGEVVHCRMAVSADDGKVHLSSEGAGFAGLLPGDSVVQSTSDNGCVLTAVGTTAVCDATVILGATAGSRTLQAFYGGLSRQHVDASSASVTFSLAPTSVAVDCGSAISQPGAVVPCVVSATTAGGAPAPGVLAVSSSEPSDLLSAATCSPAPGAASCGIDVTAGPTTGARTITAAFSPAVGAGEAASTGSGLLAVTTSVAIPPAPPLAATATVSCPDVVAYGGSGRCSVQVLAGATPAGGTVTFDPSGLFAGVFTPATCTLAADGSCAVQVTLDAPSGAQPTDVGFLVGYSGSPTVTAAAGQGVVRTRLLATSTRVSCGPSWLSTDAVTRCTVTTSTETGTLAGSGNLLVTTSGRHDRIGYGSCGSAYAGRCSFTLTANHTAGPTKLTVAFVGVVVRGRVSQRRHARAHRPRPTAPHPVPEDRGHRPLAGALVGARIHRRRLGYRATHGGRAARGGPQLPAGGHRVPASAAAAPGLTPVRIATCCPCTRPTRKPVSTSWWQC